MPYKKPGLWDYCKLAVMCVRWRFWKPPTAPEKPCEGCKHLGNFPRGICEACGAPAWECWQTKHEDVY